MSTRHEDRGLGTEVAVHTIVTAVYILGGFVTAGFLVGLSSWRQWVGLAFVFLLFMSVYGMYEEMNRRLMRIQDQLRQMECERERTNAEMLEKLELLNPASGDADVS